MIIEFRTKRNINGNARFLAIDTEKKLYCKTSRTWIVEDALEIKTEDYRYLIKKCELEGFEESIAPIN